MTRNRGGLWAASVAAGMLAGAACTAACAADPTEIVVADPIVATREKLERYCLTVTMGSAPARRLDLNGDGVDDMVVSHAVVCDGFRDRFCGLEGCDGDVYLGLPNGAYLSTLLPADVVAGVTNGLPSVTSKRLGESWIWDGDRFTPAAEHGRVRDLRPSAYARALGRDGSEEADAPAWAAASAALGEGWGAAQATETAPQGSDVAELIAFGLEAGLSEPIAADLAGLAAEVGRWALLPGLDAQEARALVRGEDGGSALVLSCRAGAPAVMLTLKPSTLAAERLPAGADAGVEIAFVVGGGGSDVRRLRRLESGLWRDAVEPRGSLLSALVDGSTLTVREPGATDRVARFSLEGAAEAIGGLLGRCGI